LEVCQIFGTLIADEQQVYDLNNLDDQLVLGIKGTLSVVELKVIRQRMLAGQEAKARRGELFKRLPIGYARDPVGKIMFHPDRRVCEAIQLVFAKFRELWSVRQTFQWFRDHDLELPVNPIQGTRLIWKTASLCPWNSRVERQTFLCVPFGPGPGDLHLSCLVFVRRLNRHFNDLRTVGARRRALANRASRVVQACAKGRIDQTSTDLANGADGLLRTV
jgi:hypothetical protein